MRVRGYYEPAKFHLKETGYPLTGYPVDNITIGICLQYGEDGGGGKRAGGRRNSLCAGWTNVLSPLDQNRTGIYQIIPFRASFNIKIYTFWPHKT